MNQHNGLRRKLEKYAIPNLTLYLIICYGIGYLMQYLVPAGYQYLMLDPFLVLKGQVWRLVTWILIPPDSSNIFFVLITLYLYYSLGGLLERIWGTYKYNVYLFSGLLFTILGAFVLCGYSVLMGAQPTMYTGLYLLNNGSAVYFGQFSTYYINMSIFLACAASIPDVQVLLMFLFPIKVKWIGIVYGIILLVNCIQGGIATCIFPAFERKDASVSGADQAAAGISSEDASGRADERDHAAQMRGLRQNGAGRRRSGIPFLLQV